jgi:C-terminal processing protease CtpA/Prc
LNGIHTTEGICLKVVPRQPIYSGKLYILTNGNTASTCEPIVYSLQRLKRATIVGTKTAGAMLSAEIFEVENGFSMMIPTADYYTFDGKRLDKIGVEPNIDVQTDALEYVLKNIILSE